MIAARLLIFSLNLFIRLLRPFLFLILFSSCTLNTNIELRSDYNGDIASESSITILGVQGASDTISDEYLTSGQNPTVSWLSLDGIFYYAIQVFESDGVTSRCAEQVVYSSNITTTLVYPVANCTLSEGENYKVKIKALNDQQQAISTEATEFDFMLDSSPPDAPASVNLYSQYTSDFHGSTTVSPDITVTGGVSDSASGFSGYQAEIRKASDSSVVVAWTESIETSKFRISNITLQDSTEYKIYIRSVDRAGNTSSEILANSNFTVAEILPPFVGTTIVAGTTSKTAGEEINGTTRIAPLDTETFELSGIVGWNPSTSHNGIFIKTNSITNENNAQINVNGQSNIGVAGGKGAGGGGGGGSSGCVANPGGDGGDAGSDGLDGNGASPGSGGSGSTLYVNGYSDFGIGGDGARGRKGNPGGLGGNGGGGGGTGGFNNACSPGAGGAGGGGLIAIETNSITGTALLSALGGTTYKGASAGGGGGGGVIWVATASYQANYLPLVSGGRGYNDGTSGTARIFQKISDGSYIQRRFQDHWSDDSTATIVSEMFPFPMNNIIDPAALSNTESLTSTTFLTENYSLHTPLTAKTINFSGTIISSRYAMFYYADEVNFGASVILNVAGSNGSNSNGGDGGSGGGSGRNGGACGSSPGFPGGSGTSGEQNPSTDILGGFGYGAINNPLNFAFGLGGDGGEGGSGALNGGLGIHGAGGGGGGGNTTSCTTGAGGGGGGGLIVVIANSIIGSAVLEAKGGDASSNLLGAGGGGGGVIWIATKSYVGNSITPNVSGGAGTGNGASGQAGMARIFQINSDNTFTERSFAETW